MPVPDETNNFATHGKAPIPSNASGSFVVPRDKEVGPKDDRPKKETPIPPLAAPPVASAPSNMTSVGIAAPPSGAAFVSAPPASATMTPSSQPAQTFGMSPLGPQPQQMPQIPIQKMSTEEMMRELQQMGLQQPTPQPMPQQIIPQQIIPQQMGEAPQQMPQPMPQPMPQQMPMQQMPIQQMPMQQQMMPQQVIPQQIIPQQMGEAPQQMPQPMPQPMPQQMPMQQMPMQQMPMQQMPMPQQMMPQQMTPQMQQQMMQQMQMQQMQQQMMQQQMPMQAPVQPIQPANSTPLTPSLIADMQAEIMAKALIQSQQAGIRPRPKQTYKREEPERESVYEEPTQEDIRDKKPPEYAPSNIAHGERIILPIHDTTLEERRDDMSRRMTELLGDTDEAEPEAISTKSMKKKAKEMAKKARQAAQEEDTTLPTLEGDQEAAEMAAQEAAAGPTPAELFPEYTLSGEAIAPQAPLIDPLNNPQREVVPRAPQEQEPEGPQIYTLASQLPPDQRMSAEEQQYYVEQEYRPQTPEDSHDITSQMQAAQVQSQLQEQEQSMDPRLAAIQQQRLMQAEEEKAAEEQRAEEAARAAEEAAAALRARGQQAQQAQARPTTGVTNPNRRNIRVNAEVVKKAALATILRRPPEPEPAPEPVETIRPAYVAELEEELASDMGDKEGSKMDALMAAELADDEITNNAKQIQAETAKEETSTDLPVMPDEVLKAIESAAPASEANPNIGGADGQ